MFKTHMIGGETWKTVATTSLKNLIGSKHPDFPAALKCLHDDEGEGHILVIKKCFGLTHPEHPFVESRLPIVILDDETQQSIGAIVFKEAPKRSVECKERHRGYLRLMEGHTVPFTFRRC